jgi:UDP-N-acetylmuramoyl-tripeptide--D-alanyl-D-alanine ligase
MADLTQLFEFLGFIWFFRTSKTILFYLYLWQLKEYHTGRFLAHFSTKKGKELIFNPVNYFKIFLLAVFPFLPLGTFFGTIATYLLEFPKVFIDLVAGKIKRPVLTKKALFLIFITIISEIAFSFFVFDNMGFWQTLRIFQKPSPVVIFFFLLLLFDVLTPIIASALVLIFQPFTVLMRNRIIKKAKAKRQKFSNLLTIGITGSYGKTSTKEFLYTILAEKFGQDKVLKTQAHQNSEVGISQCVLNNLNENHRIFIVEMGAYNVGGIKLLCDIVLPKIGILTGINEQHMATFGSQENIIKAKYELIESLPKNGLAFFNARNKYCSQLYEKTAGVKKFLYGQEAKFFGQENILGAIAVAKELEMTTEEIQRGLDKIENKMPGIQIKEGIGGLKIIDATYSANPDGVIANLEYLKNNFSGRKIIIMPCLIELGKASKEVHQRIGQKIAKVCDLAIITTLDRFKEIKEFASEKVIFIDNPKKIFEKVKEFTKEGDVILLESRVPKKLTSLLLG